MPVKVGLKYIEKWKTDLEKEVVAYEQQPLAQGKIVFYGPSYFKRCCYHPIRASRRHIIDQPTAITSWRALDRGIKEKQNAKNTPSAHLR